MKKILKPIVAEFETKLAELSRDEILVFMSETSLRALPKLVEAADDPEYAVALLGVFVIDAMLADGFIAEEEYRIFAESYSMFFGHEPSRSECEHALKTASSDFHEVIGGMRNIMFALDDATREDIVKVCMCIFAVDGKIDEREKKWLFEILGEEA